MPWDTWALLSITILCVLVIAWSCWGFYQEAHAPTVDRLRLPLTGGGHIDVPLRRGQPTGRHHPLHRK